jgi:hypothetical protein
MSNAITKDQYLQAMALLILAQQRRKFVEECERAIYAALGMEWDDGGGHIGDAVWSDYSIDELLRKLSIEKPGEIA